MDILGSESSDGVDSQQFPVQISMDFMPVCSK
jgi:hypothetical protein